MQIKNNVFIVTGGGSGLGAAVARTLVAEGTGCHRRHRCRGARQSRRNLATTCVLPPRT